MSKGSSGQASSTTIDRRRTKLIGVAALCAAILAGAAFWVFKRPHAPTPIADFRAPFTFGRFTVPPDNPLTEEAFQLGRHLFYDPMLSGSNTMACSDCHDQALGFADPRPTPTGAHGMELEFNSMTLANLLWGPQRFFWDGRSESLEHQVLEPLRSTEEMDQPLDELIGELSASRQYRRMFRAAYGGITEENVARALATFLRMLISQNSKYDRYLAGDVRLTDEEELGRKLFMAHPDVKVALRGGNCIDCHSQFVTAGFSEALDGFSNNGLDSDANLADGLARTTGRATDKGRFKTPSLRNVAVTGPYMHDGRFETLEEVLQHYNHGIQVSETLSPLILEADNATADPTAARGLNLAEHEVAALIAFLHTLTDEAFLQDPKISNPFEIEN